MFLRVINSRVSEIREISIGPDRRAATTPTLTIVERVCRCIAYGRQRAESSVTDLRRFEIRRYRVHLCVLCYVRNAGALHAMNRARRGPRSSALNLASDIGAHLPIKDGIRQSTTGRKAVELVSWRARIMAYWFRQCQVYGGPRSGTGSLLLNTGLNGSSGSCCSPSSIFRARCKNLQVWSGRSW